MPWTRGARIIDQTRGGAANISRPEWPGTDRQEYTYKAMKERNSGDGPDRASVTEVDWLVGDVGSVSIIAYAVSQRSNKSLETYMAQPSRRIRINTTHNFPEWRICTATSEELYSTTPPPLRKHSYIRINSTLFDFGTIKTLAQCPRPPHLVPNSA
ncbi:hypothetical protein AG1IA_04900 [Rhizoctonia solani AG-1 IA]|uniref:Uncharacterized protein n=1 Tax=Thanatephorus cucumeris (strain AG1-IA) TaxID=983506 RepID=L8WSV8_THACA|nr:hypothetical protein AG1IA_04900 [Rhizoctonia solani AG-1 IA]